MINNVEIKTPLKIDEALSRISAKTKAISSCFAYAMASTLEKDSKLVGEVSKKRVILARARPLSNGTSKPIFNAQVVESSSGSVIKGTFEVNCFYKYFFWISTIIFGIVEIFILLSVFAPENQPLLSLRNFLVVALLPGLQVAAYLFTRYTRDRLFEEDSKWIENELKQILA